MKNKLNCKINENRKEMIESTDKCVCGHIVRDHTIKMKKRMMNSWVVSECQLCHCENLRTS